MNNLLFGIILSNLIVGILVWIVMDHKNLKLKNDIYGNEIVIDELTRLLVILNEQGNQKSSDND